MRHRAAGIAIRSALLTFFNSATFFHTGVLLVFAWLFLSPTAVFEWPMESGTLNPLMKKLHRGMQGLATFLTFLAMIIPASDADVNYDKLSDVPPPPPTTPPHPHPPAHHTPHTPHTRRRRHHGPQHTHTHTRRRRHHSPQHTHRPTSRDARMRRN